jgi:hypothetical protein
VKRQTTRAMLTTREGNANTSNTIRSLHFPNAVITNSSFPRNSLSSALACYSLRLFKSLLFDCVFPFTMADTAPAPAAAPATTGATAPTTGAAASAPNAPTDANAGSRGLPYYEKLRRELRDTLQKKRLMDKSMVSGQSSRASPSQSGLRSARE